MVTNYDNDQFKFVVGAQALCTNSKVLLVHLKKWGGGALVKEGDLVLICQSKETVWQLGFLSDLDL